MGWLARVWTVVIGTAIMYAVLRDPAAVVIGVVGGAFALLVSATIDALPG